MIFQAISTFLHPLEVAGLPENQAFELLNELDPGEIHSSERTSYVLCNHSFCPFSIIGLHCPLRPTDNPPQMLENQVPPFGLGPQNHPFTRRSNGGRQKVLPGREPDGLCPTKLGLFSP